MSHPLSSAQFEGFHGTSRDIPKSVRPATEHQKGSVWDDTGAPYGQSARAHAYATTDEHVAWDFAKMSADRWGGRERVYKVAAPSDKVKIGAYNADHPKRSEWEESEWGAPEDLKEYVAPRFKVTDRIDIKPGHQGTFPEIDWNQHKHPLAPYWYDANHPRLDDRDPLGFRNIVSSNDQIKSSAIGAKHGWAAASEFEHQRGQERMQADGVLPPPRREQVKGQAVLFGMAGTPNANALPPKNPLMPQTLEQYRASRPLSGRQFGLED